MKKILLILFLIIGWSAEAQKLTVESFTPKSNDLSARTESRLDNNGTPCALVKVQLASSGALFEGNVMGTVEYKTSEYWVYMPQGSKRLTVKLEGYLPLAVEFADYGISSLEPRTTYQLVILGVVAQPQIQTTVTVTDTVFLPSSPIEVQPSQKKEKLTIMATAMPARNISEGLKQAAWGITVGMGNTWGWYVNATSNFVFEKSAGNVSGTDGLTDGGELILFNGERSVSLHQATGGVTYRVSDHLRVMLGAGYGMRNMYAQSEEGEYYRIGGGGGFSVETGVCLTVSILSFEASVCSPALSGISARVGIGIEL